MMHPTATMNDDNLVMCGGAQPELKRHARHQNNNDRQSSNNDNRSLWLSSWFVMFVCAIIIMAQHTVLLQRRLLAEFKGSLTMMEKGGNHLDMNMHTNMNRKMKTMASVHEDPDSETSYLNNPSEPTRSAGPISSDATAAKSILAALRHRRGTPSNRKDASTLAVIPPLSSSSPPPDKAAATTDEFPWMTHQSEPIPSTAETPTSTTMTMRAKKNQSKRRKQPQVDKSSTSKCQNRQQRPTAMICWMGVVKDFGYKDIPTSSLVQNVLTPLLEAGYDLRILMLAQSYSHDLFPAFREPYSFTQSATYNASVYVHDNVINTDTNSSSYYALSERAKKIYQDPLNHHLKRKNFEKKKYNKHGRLGQQMKWMPVEHHDDLKPSDITTAQEEQKFKTIERRLRQWLNLQQKAGTGPGTSILEVQKYAPLVNPPVPIDYVKAMIQRDAAIAIEGHNVKDRTTLQALARVIWRTVNDVRQLHSNTLCGSWVAQQQELLLQQAQERRNDGSTCPNEKKAKNDVLVVRIGEDTQIDEPIPMNKISKLQSTQLLVIPARTKRGQVNDQIEVMAAATTKKRPSLSFQRILDYFAKPYEKIYEPNVFKEGNKAGTIYGKIKFHETRTTLADYLQMVHQSLGFTIVRPPPSDARYRWKKLPKVDVPKSWDINIDTPHPTGYPLSRESFAGVAQANKVSSTGASSGQMSALVCVTGQVGRLELENKLKNLLWPMHQLGGYKIDLVLELSSGKPVYNLNKGSRWYRPDFSSEEEIWDYLNRTQVSSFVNKVLLRPYKPPPSLPVNPQYMYQKIPDAAGVRRLSDGKDKAIKLKAIFDTVDRILVHTRMMDGYRRCDLNFEELTANSNNNNKRAALSAENLPQTYDLYVRLRDDVGFSEAVPPELYDSSSVPGNRYLTHIRRNNDGINDRMAFVRDPKAAQCYFHLPFTRMFDGQVLPLGAYNTESYFHQVYMQSQDCIGQDLKTRNMAINPFKISNGKLMD